MKSFGLEKVYCAARRGSFAPGMMLGDVASIEHLLFKLGRKRIRVVDDKGRTNWIRARNHERDREGRDRK